MRLYELTSNYRQVAAMEDLDPETLKDTLDAINDEIEEKVLNIGFLIKEKKFDVKTLDEAIKELQAKKETLKKSIDYLQQYMYDSMKLTDLQKIKSPLISVWIQNNPMSVKIVKEDAVPSDYFIPQPPKIDKKEIRKALKEGTKIPGAELVQTEGVRIK